MAAWIFRLCAGLALVGILAHELLGAPLVLPPLADAGLSEEVLWLHHFSWHVGSIAVAAMAAMFGYASAKPEYLPMAVIATGMSLGFSGLGIGLAIFGNDVMWGTPAPYVWTLIAFLGGVGVWVNRYTNGTTHSNI